MVAAARVAVFLRLLEGRVRAAASVLHRVQLRGGRGHHQMARPARGAVVHDRGRRHQSPAARLLQIHELHPRRARARGRAGDSSVRHHPAAGHLVLHVHADRLHRGRLSRPETALPAARLLGVRRLFPAPHRGAHRAALGNHPAVRREAAQGKPRGHGCGHCDVPARARKKGAARGPGGALRRHGLCRGRGGDGHHVVRRLARDAGLRDADLL